MSPEKEKQPPLPEPVTAAPGTGPIDRAGGPQSKPLRDPLGFLRLLGLVYLLGSLVVLFFPSEFLYLVNIAPAVFKLADPIPAPVERLWLILASSWLFLMALLSLTRTAPWIQLASLLFSGLALLTAFFTDKPCFAYLLFGAANTLLAFLLLIKLLSPRRNMTNREEKTA